MKIAKRMLKIDASGIRKVFDLAAKMDRCVNLSIGQPDFDVPEEIKNEAIKAIRNGYNKYTQTQGIEQLLSKVKEKYKKEHQFSAEAGLITSGVSAGIFLSIMALVDSGAEVLIPDPYFVMYKHLTELIGGIPVFIDTYPSFQIDVSQFKKKITKKTKLLIINSPNNPTGAVYPKETLKEIATIADKYGIFIISDEIYEPFVYDEKYTSICEFTENVLVLNGFSKSVAMTGWRLGFALGPKSIIDEMTKLQQYTYVCAPSFAQYAGLVAMDFDTTKFKEEYKKKRDLIFDGIKDRFNVIKPGGAFYIFPEAPQKDGDGFARKAIENKLLIIPGSVFSEKSSHFRISYAASDSTIKEGIKILNKI